MQGRAPRGDGIQAGARGGAGLPASAIGDPMAEDTQAEPRWRAQEMGRHPPPVPFFP